MPSIIVCNRAFEITIIAEIKQTHITQIRLSELPAKDAYPAEWRSVYQQFRDYLDGNPVIFDLPLEWRRFSDFRKTIYRQLIKVPIGSTITYGELSQQIGGRKYARAVGRAMAANPYPIAIPCHRVVAKKSVGGYSGGGGLSMKRRLLEFERMIICELQKK